MQGLEDSALIDPDASNQIVLAAMKAIADPKGVFARMKAANPGRPIHPLGFIGFSRAQGRNTGLLRVA